MPESFFDLTEDDRKAAIKTAAATLGREYELVEKDVWVVWTLNVLFTSEFRDSLVFKGGTSLSKAYGVIDRFSEDVDLTYDVRKLIPETTKGADLPPSKTQADTWTDKVKEALPDWIATNVVPLLEEAARKLPNVQINRTETNVHIEYGEGDSIAGYVRPRVLLEFGARSTGEPAEYKDVTCDAAAVLQDFEFPIAKVRAMKPTRTFWEKATAAHVYCVRGAFRGGDRWSRHWYDMFELDRHEFAEVAINDRALATDVADHKSRFFREKDVDYHAAISGGLRIVPESPEAFEALREDYSQMLRAGMLHGTPPAFDELIAHCRQIERRANEAAALESHTADPTPRYES